MPYIKRGNRKFWDQVIQMIESENNNTDYEAGELNYFISRLLWRQMYSKKSYKKANELMGLLECIKQEFYRRVVAPYEDIKAQENGDVDIA
jgi:hypothetical protein